jgi:16S rRNA (guanine1207-N2)-methyltransferase
VICNPPFHLGRAADPALGQAFVATAAAVLRGSGTLWLVANRHLPYEAALGRLFRDVGLLEETADYKLIRASRPDSAGSRRQASLAPRAR